MPRDTNGVYSLPLPDVQPATTIEDSWANTTMNDLAAALTDSLSRTGQGGMQYPLTFGSGDVNDPGIAWTLETGTGFYRNATGDMRTAVQGYGDVMRWYQGTAYVRNVADTDWAAIVYAGGSGTVPNGTTALDTLVWDTVTSAWIRQAKNAGGSLPVGSVSLTALQWNNASAIWEAVTPTTFTSNIDDGTVTGQTPVWDNTATQWEPTSLLTTSVVDSAVAVGSGMTTDTTHRLSVLTAMYVGSTTGANGISLVDFGGTAMFITAATRASPYVGAFPMTIAATALTLNSQTGNTAIQAGGVEAVQINTDGQVGLNGAPLDTRLRVIGDAGDTALFAVQRSNGNEAMGILANGQIRMTNLPTSDAGLPTGTLWHHTPSGELRIAP